MTSPPAPEVHSVTTARRSLAQDQDFRARQYFWLMGIRTLCFLLALLVAVLYPGWWCLLLFAAAAGLPYVAVVLANAVNVHEEGEVESVDAAALPPARGPLLLGDGTVLHPDVDGDLAPQVPVHVGEVVDAVDVVDQPQPRAGDRTEGQDRR